MVTVYLEIIFDLTDPQQIELKVPCAFRYAVYKDFLREVQTQLMGYLNSKPEDKHALIQNAIRNSTSLLEMLVAVYDKHVLNLIAYKLNTYSSLESIGQANPTSSQPKLSDFYKNNMHLNLLQEHPPVHALFQTIATDFIRNITECLDRVLNEASNLSVLFLGRDSLCLKHIISSGGDRHKQGQQVLILEFEKGIKVIYKPFNVLLDTLITANTNALKELALENKIIQNLATHGSLIENINKYSSEQIPTYIIYPCETQQVDKAYGFIEYLMHEPWPQIDMYNEILEIYTVAQLLPAIGEVPSTIDSEIIPYLRSRFESICDKSASSDINSFQSFYDALFQYELSRQYEDWKLQEKTCSFILENQEAIDRYSRHCGRLAAIARVMQVTDLHIQNLIYPYLIDLEVSFQPHVRTLNATGLFDTRVGAFIPDVGHLNKYQLLLGAKGILEETLIIEIEKNRVFIRNENGAFIATIPREKEFIQGFDEILQVLARPCFDQWLENFYNNGPIYSRVLPISTGLLQEDQSNFFRAVTYQSGKTCSQEFFTLMQQRLIKKWLNHFEEGGAISNVFIRPFFAASSSDYIYQEFTHNSLPVFYCDIKQTAMIDGNNVPIQVNFEAAESYLTQSEEFTELKDSFNCYIKKYQGLSYHQEPAFIIIQRNLIELKNSSYIQILVNEAKIIMQGFQQIYNATSLVPYIPQSRTSRYQCCNAL